MLSVFVLLLLVSAEARGSTATACEATDGNILKCRFSENINSTRTDFAVYFYPDGGGEEKLVDCAWINNGLHCIRQDGFDCKPPVTDNAVINVPTRFVNKTGSYGCNTDSYRPDGVTSCRFPGKQGTEHFSACDANSTLSGPQVILNCRFSFGVDSFTVQHNSTVVASFKKSECQSSGPCRHVPGDGRDMFSITLDMPDYPHGELLCHPDRSLSGLQVNGCSVNMKSNPPESTSTHVALPVALSIVCVLVLVSTTLALLVIRKRKKKNTQQTPKELEPL